MNHCLTFAADGSARTLWTDVLPLAELGTLTVSRASWIEFNAASQQWEVRLDPQGPAVFSHPSRTECLQWEHEHLNQ